MKKRRSLELQRELYSINPDSNRDVLTDYLQGVEAIGRICKELGEPNITNMIVFKHIIYAEGWYIGITKDNRLVYNCFEGFQNEVHSIIDKVQNTYGVELFVSLSGDISKGNGGNHR